MVTSVSAAQIQQLTQSVAHATTEFLTAYPTFASGDSGARQPVHTVYGGAQIFKAGTVMALGRLARETLETYAPTAADLATALGLRGDTALLEKIYARVQEKLRREPVEDFRIDFEDGYGTRPDAEEDADAERTAREVVQGCKDRTLPPFIGIRIKPFSPECISRAIRTFDIFLSTLLDQTQGQLPEHFVITLPKPVMPAQVAALAQLCTHFEQTRQLPAGVLKLELMIETPQSIFNERGEVALPHLVRAAQGRCIGAHFGTYDFTASNHITAEYQSMDHPACDFARHVMRIALANTGVTRSDGATNIMPVGPHRAAPGQTLSRAQQQENTRVVHHAWRLAFEHTRHSLRTGFYQGWDLYPGQLPIRYAAVYSFFLEGLASASLRLRTFIEKAAQATLVGDVFDDAATGQGLLNFFLRALNCGAIDAQDIAATGLTLEEIRSRSFVKIMAGRRAAGG